MVKFLIWFGLVISLGGIGRTEADTKEVQEKIALAYEQLYKSPGTAVHYANQAVLQAGSIGNDSLLARAFYVLGSAYTKQGLFDLCLDACFQAAEVYGGKRDAFLVTLNTTIGDAYRLLRDYEKAMEWLDRSFALCRQIDAPEELAYTYNVRGLIYATSKEYGKAERDFKKALEINRRLGNRKKMAANLNNLATFESEGEGFREKIRMLEEALEINTELNAKWSVAENYNNFGLQYYFAGRYREALQYLDASLRISEEIDARELISDNYKYRSEVYKAMGQTVKAYEYLVLQYELERKMLSAEKLSRVESRMAERKVAEHEKRLLFQQKEFKIKTLQKNLVIVTIVTLLVVSLSVYYTFHMRNKRNLLKLELERSSEHQRSELMLCELRESESEKKTALLALEFSKKEMTNLACYIKSRNDLLGKVSAMLREGYSLEGEPLKLHLKRMNSFINQYTRRNNDIQEILNYIEKLSADFISRLTALHPDLTKGEIKLASYLRIGLSNKDISLLTEVSPTSVNVARYRLRKRLNMGNDESLVEFMQKI